MSNLDIGHLPTSLDEVESLILQLYQPGAPEKVAKTQETLQILQRSPEGWQLANSLLENKNESVRFFGALTFIVKLNTDSKSLSDDDVQALLQNLIGLLIRCLQNGEGALVVRKLCSTLVAFFLQFSASWMRCVRHLLYCFCINQAVPYGSLAEAPDTPLLIENLANDKTIALLWFTANLVEEIGKTDSNSMKQHKFHRRIVPNVTDIVPLIEKYITNQSSGVTLDSKVRHEAMKCFQACVSYSHRAFIDDEIVLDPLRTLTKYAIMSLVDDNLYEVSVELISDILGNYSKFLHKEDFTLLYSIFNAQWAQERYQRLISGDFDFDSLQFGQFVVAFGDATVQDLTQKVDTDPQCHQLLSALSGLLSAVGHAVHEDKIFVPALEFWNTFVETMIDFTYSAEGKHPSWFPAAKSHVMQAIHNCWRKVQFPPPAEFNSWDSVDRTGFKDARRDVLDLLENFYIISGIQILSVFIDHAQQSINTENWNELEASLHCLTPYPDCIWEDALRDDYLVKLFNPSLFAVLINPEIEMPFRVTQAFLELVDGYGEWFAQHPENLPKALNVAFGSVGSPALAKTASQTIAKLCGDCRSILVPELGAFLQQFSSMTNASLDSRVKEGILQSIASIIQAIPDEESKVVPLEQLLHFIEVDVEHCLRLLSYDPSTAQPSNNAISGISPDNYAAASELGVKALGCIEKVAKGLQVPDDQPIDLVKRTSLFWITGNGSVIQQRVISLIDRICDPLFNRGDIVEAACYVYRAGFVERSGPFVFTPDKVAQFLLKADSQTPRLGLVIGTACSLLSSTKSGPRAAGVVDALVKWITNLLQILGEPSNDPEIAQNGIDFLYRLIPTYLDIFLTRQPPSSLEYIFIFTLKSLTGNDPLPKVAAADFWSHFLGIPDQRPPLQDSIDNAIQHLGPLLAQALVYNIGGNASRSELDKLSEPVKKLVVAQVHSKSWLETALFSDSFPSDKVTTKDKIVFLQKIMNLRGARATNQVIREFWVSCRGTNFAYTS